MNQKELKNRDYQEIGDMVNLYKENTGIDVFTRDKTNLFIQTMLEKLPNLKGELCKFYCGLTRWFLDDLNIQSIQDTNKVNKLLYNLKNSPEMDFYDEDFNGMSLQQIQDISGIDLDAETYQTPSNLTYEMFELADYNKVRQYENYANWCILDEMAFNAYTVDGVRYFIAERSDYKDVPKSRGDKYPHDDYGLSLIVIGIKNNEIISVTSRWNFDGTEDYYLNPTQLKELLGHEYRCLFDR